MFQTQRSQKEREAAYRAQSTEQVAGSGHHGVMPQFVPNGPSPSFYASTNVLYFTAQYSNISDYNMLTDSVSSTLQPALIEQEFPSVGLIEDQENYLVAVERMEVSLHGIPLVDFEDDFIKTLYGTKITFTDDFGEFQIDLLGKFFDAWQIVNYINDQLDYFKNQGSTSVNNKWVQFVRFGINPTSGRLYAKQVTTIAHDWDNLKSIQWPLALDFIFGWNNAANPSAILPATLGALPLQQYWYASRNCFDIGDALQHIRLTSNLSLVSDTLGQSTTTIITDLAPDGLLSVSGGDPIPSSTSQNQYNGYGGGTISVVPRQRLVYSPFTRRWLNISGWGPIYNLRIQCTYVDLWGRELPILLPPGGTFAIKLGFYRRNTPNEQPIAAM